MAGRPWLGLLALTLLLGCNDRTAERGKTEATQAAPSEAVSQPAPAVQPVVSSSPTPTEADAADATAPTEPAEPPKSANDEVSVQILSWQQTQELIAGRQGKVVVVDLWSTSCPPCMREFPHLVELQRRFRDQIACISVNCDYLGIAGKPPEYYRPQVLSFLAAQNATIQNVMCSVAADELFDELELPSIPAVYIYARNGALVKRFDNRDDHDGNGFSYADDIAPLVQKLIEDPALAEHTTRIP